MSSLLLESLDKCGIEYRYFSAKEVYERGLLLNEIRIILLNAKKVGEIVKEEVGQERYTEVLPFFPVCSNCGRIYTTKAYKFEPETDKVLYKCEGLEIRGKIIEGCGHEGEADITKGEGKLTWKGEFAARWKALDIRFEAYGKDIADSVKINDRICREVLVLSRLPTQSMRCSLTKVEKKSQNQQATFSRLKFGSATGPLNRYYFSC